LLALLENNYINRENECFSLIKELNSRAEEVLHKKEKQNFIHCISIPQPPTPENHIKFRKALLDTLQELDNINIRSAMNSGTDILGRFYEQFLKYGNGAKEIGIVLTPRHITEFACDVMDISHNDVVLDPTCGTGGFLVGAFDKVRKEVGNGDELINFKKSGIFGIEQDAEVVALALVNMIFRGDGRTNIIEGNCFLSQKLKNIKVTKVLMNPPFSLKSNDEQESNFIDYALSKMVNGTILFAIIPMSVMSEDKHIAWRKRILDENTLLSVVTLPEELFTPISVGTVGIFIQKGVPHNYAENVLFARATSDGFKSKKGVRFFDETFDNKLLNIKDDIKAFLKNKKHKIKYIAEVKQTLKLNMKDNKKCKLLPEFYMTTKPPCMQELSNNISQINKSLICHLINRNIHTKTISKNLSNGYYIKNKKVNLKVFKLTDFCDVTKGCSIPQSKLKYGETPYVTASSHNNGVTMLANIPANIKANTITVSLNGSVGEVFYHNEPYITNSDVAVLSIKKQYENKFALFIYTAACLMQHKWRYSYYYKMSIYDLMNMDIYIPMDGQRIDFEIIKNVFLSSYGSVVVNCLYMES
jgi:type I restriction-modification system DNA methylase subunit